MSESGDLVQGTRCPGCDQETVVYNGTYFCTECEWGMSEETETPAERRIIKTYLLQRLKEAQRTGNVEVQNTMSFYLIGGGYVYDGEEV